MADKQHEERTDPFGGSPVMAAIGGMAAPAEAPLEETLEVKPEPRAPRKSNGKPQARKKVKPVFDETKEQLSCRISPEVRQMARRAVAYTPRLTMADFLESAITAEYNRHIEVRGGEDFPDLDGDLPKGRPIR